MKKMFKRTTAIAASALMLTQMVPYNVFAEPAVTGPNSLVIHPYLLNDEDYDTAKNAAYVPTGTEDDEDHANIYDSAPAEADIEFTVTEVTSTGQVKDGGVTRDAAKSFNGLPDGYYKITAANDTTDDDFQGIESFFIALPSGENRTVHIYPKLTNNHDNGDNNTPDTLIDPEDETSTDKHSIQLTKLLSDGTPWSSGMTATFQVYSKDTMGNWVDCGTHDVRSNGKLNIDGLPYGEYYLYETAAPTGYLKNSKPIKFVLDGTTASIQKVDFTNDQILKVAKVIDADGGGHEYNWTITADLPDENPENLMSYSVTDTYTNLTNVAIESVKVGSTELTFAANGSADYHTTTTDNSITVVIDDLDALNVEGGSVVIKVTSDIPNDFSVDEDENVTNSSSLSYQYAYDPTTDPDIPSIIPENIPGLPDPDPEDPDNPDNPPVINYPGTTPDPDTIVTVIPGTITIKNVDFEDEDYELTDGAYFVPGCSNHYDSDEEPYVATVTNMAPGVYEIRQTGTQEGYKTADPITIYIDANGQAYLGDSAVPANALDGNVVTFVNMKDADGFQLPFTGTTATIVFTVTGIAIMAGAAFFIIILFKKRDEEEEEQKNA